MILSDKIERSDMIKGSKKENGKEKRITIRLTEAEHKKILTMANNKNISISELLRLIIQEKINK